MQAVLVTSVFESLIECIAERKCTLVSRMYPMGTLKVVISSLAGETLLTKPWKRRE